MFVPLGMDVISAATGSPSNLMGDLRPCHAAWRGAMAWQLACCFQDAGKEHFHMAPADDSACMTSHMKTFYQISDK